MGLIQTKLKEPHLPTYCVAKDCLTLWMHTPFLGQPLYSKRAPPYLVCLCRNQTLCAVAELQHQPLPHLISNVFLISLSQRHLLSTWSLAVDLQDGNLGLGTPHFCPVETISLLPFKSLLLAFTLWKEAQGQIQWKAKPRVDQCPLPSACLCRRLSPALSSPGIW